MGVKTDRKTLTAELKKAAKSGGNFVYAPSSSKAKPAVLMVSQKKIAPADRSAAKASAGAAKVYHGVCEKVDSVLVFRCAIKPSSTLEKELKRSIHELSDYTIAKVEVTFAADVVAQDFADDEDLEAMATARRKSAAAAGKWIEEARPADAAGMLRTRRDGDDKFGRADWAGAIDAYDSMLAQVVAARKAVSKRKPKADEAEPAGLKRKKLGAEYVGEDKQVGWRAPRWTDEQVSDRAVLKALHGTAAYKTMEWGEFLQLVKAKEPRVIELIGKLRAALQRGDDAVVEKISRLAGKIREERQQVRESDKVTTAYYTPEQRRKHGLEVGADGLLYDAKGNLFDKRRGFVLDPDTGNLVVFKPQAMDLGEGKKVVTHHSSPLAGGDVAGAGHIEVVDGLVESIDDASGHYKPDASFTLQTLKQLEKLGAKLVDDTIVDEDDEEVSAKKQKKYKLVKAYELERKKKQKELLELWNRDVELGKAKRGKRPELPPYDKAIRRIRDRLLEDGVGPRQRSTQVKLQGKVGLSQEQFDACKGDVRKINEVIAELTGKRDLLPASTDPRQIAARPALNLMIGDLLKRTLSKEQFEQTGGNEDQIRKKDVLNEQIATEGRRQALARAVRDLGAGSVIEAASRIMDVSTERLAQLETETLEEVVLGGDKRSAVETLEDLEHLRTLQDRALELLGLERTDAGVEAGLGHLAERHLEGILDGSMSPAKARRKMGLATAEDSMFE